MCGVLLMLSRVRLEGWNQFGRVDIEPDENLTILTGQNGSGKTTVLRLLSRHLGWGFDFMRTPLDEGDDFEFGFRVSLLQSMLGDGGRDIGFFEFEDGQKITIQIPEDKDEPTFRHNFGKRADFQGVFIPSTRPEFDYSPVSNVPIESTDPGGMLREIEKKLKNLSQNKNLRDGVGSPIKEQLLGLGYRGDAGEIREPDSLARELFLGFEERLEEVLPDDLGFRSLEVRQSSEVVLETGSGDFSLEAVSGGISALITITWIVYLQEWVAEGEYYVLIDEPENHLHPEIQKSIMPSLVESFDNARFIVATHSPLVVGSVRDSTTFALAFDETGKVQSEELDFETQLGSANEVLEDVLGLDSTHPYWSDEVVLRLLDEHLGEELSAEDLRDLNESLEELGLSHRIDEALIGLVEEAD